MNRKTSFETFRKVLHLVRRHTAALVVSAVLAAVSVGCSLYVPVLAGRAIDCILGPGQVDFTALGVFCRRIAAVCIVSALSQWLMSAVHNRVTFRVTRQVRTEAFRHLQTLPLSYLDVHPAGELVSRIITDADQLADGLLMGFTQLFSGVLTILGTLVIMLVIDWRIALVILVLTPLSLFAAKFISGKTYSLFRQQSAVRAEQTAYLEEMMEGQKVVRAFSHEQAAISQFDEINERLRSCSLRATFFSSLTNPVTRFVSGVIYALVGMAGALSAVAGAVSVGTLTVFLSYADQYSKPFNEISGVITELQNALACAARVFELLEEPSETEQEAALPPAQGQVALEDVSFSYVPEKPLMEHLDLSVQPGSRVAIVGPTGCGKTTLMNLLLRFYDVTDGAVRVDGTDVRTVSRGSLRKNYGMVLQETWLRSGTVRDNIRLGRPDASEEEIVAAAKAAHAHSFIRRLPQGYDTELGEGGGSLSQGQKQLLCIARVMLALPPMLILDEATSSIDTRTELKIQDAFAEMMRGRTSFIVAHRLSTVREADLILVMKDGKIVETGTHETLLARKGFYEALYSSQFSQQ